MREEYHGCSTVVLAVSELAEVGVRESVVAFLLGDK
jgi:hypothetical protein